MHFALQVCNVNAGVRQMSDLREIKDKKGACDIFPDVLAKLLALRNASSKPPIFEQDSLFRIDASILLRYTANLVHDKGDCNIHLKEISAYMASSIIDNMRPDLTTLASVCGGHHTANLQWSKDLSDTCSLEDLKRTYDGVLARCHGREMKASEAGVKTLLDEWRTHLACMKKLDPKSEESMKGHYKPLIDEANAHLSRYWATKLEHHACKLFFGAKDKLDKKDFLKGHQTEFDAHELKGGSAAFLHPKVLEIIGTMKAFGPQDQESVAVPPKKQKGGAAVAVSAA